MSSDLTGQCVSCGDPIDATEPHLVEWFEETGELICFPCWEDAMSDEVSCAAEDHEP